MLLNKEADRKTLSHSSPQYKYRYNTKEVAISNVHAACIYLYYMHEQFNLQDTY